MSLETANNLGDLANWLLLFGAFISIVASFVIYKTSEVKERHWDADRQKSNENIANVIVQSDQLKKETAEANARAAEANLALEKLKAPRSLSSEQKEILSKKLAPFAGQTFTAVLPASSFDAPVLWKDISDALGKAGWTREMPAGAAAGDPPAGISISSFLGVQIATSPSASPNTKKAAISLISELKNLGIAATPGITTDHKEKRPDIITVQVGLKPN